MIWLFALPMENQLCGESIGNTCVFSLLCYRYDIRSHMYLITCVHITCFMHTYIRLWHTLYIYAQRVHQIRMPGEIGITSRKHDASSRGCCLIHPSNSMDKLMLLIFACICIHIHTYICLYVHIYIYIYLRVQIYVYSIIKHYIAHIKIM